MKKLFTILVSCLLIASVFAQSPEKISYQAVIRNSSNQLITNKQVGMKISILKNSATGTVVYAETQQPSTNSNGLISIQIGDGTIVSGSFPGIDWSNGTYFIKTETDPTGNTNYTITGTSQLLSVPYAMYAKKSGSVDITGNESVFNEWDKNSNNDVNITGNQVIYGEKTFEVNIVANGIALPYTFGPDTNYVGSEGAFIGFGHYGESEDFIGYKANRFYFKDSPGGADVTDPDVIVGGKIGIGVEAPAEKLEVDGNVDMHNNSIKNLANPVNAQDAATKAYFDASVASGIAGDDTTNWNNKQEQLTAGTGIDITGNVISTTSSATTYSVGDFAQGGIVFWVDETGQHGLVAAKVDQGSGSMFQWYNGSYTDTEAHGDGVYSGEMNTMLIIANQGSNSNDYAAGVCANYTVTESGVTYGDWYLPSKEELDLMYQNKATIEATAGANGGSGFAYASYWSSSEASDGRAWIQYITGNQYESPKDIPSYVRAVRAF